MRRVLLAAVAVLAAATAATAATAEPGVTATTILIGGTVPLSGEAAAFGTVGPGAKAYFDYVNSKGGVNGRKIEYRYYDDAYNPAQTVQQTRRLVEQDGVLAIFNAVGTANNLAIRDYLNAQKVPQLFAGDGSQALGGALGPLPVDGRLPAELPRRGRRAGARSRPARRRRHESRVLLETTELGKDMTRGLSRAIAGKGPRIVASQSYELTSTDVVVADREAEGVRGRHADALRDPEVHDPGRRRDAEARLEAAALPRLGLDRADDHGDRPRQRPAADARGARDRVRQEPERPGLAEGSGSRALPSILKRFAPGAKTTDVYHWYGMTVAWTMVDTLRRAGKSLTRASLLRGRAQPGHDRQPVSPARHAATNVGARTRSRSTPCYLYRYDNRQWVRAAGPFPAR